MAGFPIDYKVMLFTLVYECPNLGCNCLAVLAVLVQNHRPLYTATKRALTFLNCSANGAVSVLQQLMTTVTIIN